MVVDPIKRGISISARASAEIGWMEEERPRINIILKMLEPTTFPRARPLSPFLEAVTEVTSSGREVPIATMVKPINVSLRPNAVAMAQALSTTRSPPKMIPARPMAM